MKSNEQLIENIIKANSIRRLLESGGRLENLIRNYWNVVNVELLANENEQRNLESEEKESLINLSKSIESKDYETLQYYQEAFEYVISEDLLNTQLKEMISELVSLKESTFRREQTY